MTAFADTRRGDNKMKQMTLEEISKAAASGAFRKIPVSREIYTSRNTESPAGRQQPLLHARKRGG